MPLRLSRNVRRLLGLVAGVYGVFVLMLAVFMRTYGDVTPTGMLLVFAPRWLFVVPWAMLALVTCYVWYKIAAFAVVAAFVTALALGNFALPGVGGRALTSRALRVVTYNTDGSTALAGRVRDDLVLWNADVTVFQDCAPLVADSLRAIAGPSFHRSSEFCIVSRLPLERLDTLATASERPRTPAVRLRVTTDRGPVFVYAVHFYSPRDALWAARNLNLGQLDGSIAQRTLQSRAVARWVQESTLPSVVMGDFNLPDGSAILRHDWGNFEDAFSARGFGFGYTMFAGKFAVRIDHVLLSSELGTDRVVSLRRYPSEHQPVLADVAWRL